MRQQPIVKCFFMVLPEIQALARIWMWNRARAHIVIVGVNEILVINK